VRVISLCQVTVVSAHMCLWWLFNALAIYMTLFIFIAKDRWENLCSQCPWKYSCRHGSVYEHDCLLACCDTTQPNIPEDSNLQVLQFISLLCNLVQSSFDVNKLWTYHQYWEHLTETLQIYSAVSVFRVYRIYWTCFIKCLWNSSQCLKVVFVSHSQPLLLMAKISQPKSDINDISDMGQPITMAIHVKSVSSVFVHCFSFLTHAI
jgi:hypothetical protein